MKKAETTNASQVNAVNGNTKNHLLPESEIEKMLIRQIRKLIAIEGGQNKFAKRIGVNKSRISKALNKDTKDRISLNMLIKTKIAFNVSFDWLLLGQAVPSSGVLALDLKSTRKSLGNIFKQLKKQIKKEYQTTKKGYNIKKHSCIGIEFFIQRDILPDLTEEVIEQIPYGRISLGYNEIVYISQQLNVSIEVLLTNQL